MTRPMTVRRTDPPGLPAAPGLISQVVTVTGGRLVHLSGQVAQDETGTPTGGDHAAQAAAVARNIDTALAAAGATRDDVVKETIYVVDYTPDILRPVLAALRDGVRTVPASTLVPVPVLFAPGYLLEVDVTAALPAPAPAPD
ncbi:RidA family protein [Streptomyces sp. TRM 70361]|uniref:RidA family protein n=1 Tax=Streptomyces sp. TRM 70361 TaxID=3116553 RepID=UPI002E7B381B|nr:RidA family protein [Streptomyces sp. TRM 70361]MEE1940613.1 RidA family protein [Streptomyces sp. TRM 70361]